MSYAVENPGWKIVAGGTALDKHLLFKLDTTNNYPCAVVNNADTDLPIGVTLMKSEAGEALNFKYLTGEVCLVTVSGVITEGTAITGDTAGRVKTAASGDRDLGIALVTSTADGEVIPCVLRDAGLVA
jgi:hypothetical protein